ncbi:MAG: hypothetical protein N4A45_04785 [Flavobacteriales bacterium]|jgi:hypothetical protein|nr:hypothetical protein [Flavobacteriales bacterium]
MSIRVVFDGMQWSQKLHHSCQFEWFLMEYSGIKIASLLSVRVVFDGMQWSQKLYREQHTIVKKVLDTISFPFLFKEITRTDREVK